MEKTFNDYLPYSTVRIEAIKNNNVFSTGTGFFFLFCEDELGFVPGIVTNKHVVEGAEKLRFLLRFEDLNNKGISAIENNISMPIEINNNNDNVIHHPEDDVDLCVIPITKGFYDSYKLNYLRPFYYPITRRIIRNDQDLLKLHPIQEVTMIGYPNGLWDTVNNFPLIRRGATATQIKHNYNGKNEFVIDIACYGGSSGSPIFIHNLNSYIEDNEIKFGSRIIFVGVLYAGHVYNSVGQIINTQAVNVPVSVTQNMLNLGLVIKTNKVLDFDSLIKEKLKL